MRQSTEGDVPQLRLPTPTGTRHTHAQAHAHVPHTPVHAHASTHVHTCILMHTPYIQPMHSCMHAHTSHTHACTHAYVHTHMLIHKCTSNMLMHIPPTHACIHTHVCTHTENKPGPSSPSLPYPAKTTAWPRRAAFCLPGPSLALSTHIRPHPVSPTVTQSKLCLSAEMSPQEPGLALLPMSTPAGRAGHPLPPRPQNLGHVAQGRVRPGNFLGWPTGRPGPQGQGGAGPADCPGLSHRNGSPHTACFSSLKTATAKSLDLVVSNNKAGQAKGRTGCRGEGGRGPSTLALPSEGGATA